jgi:cob(I)alamin adenosyltransferase
MVYLNRIYTRTGDDGTTGLGDGTRVPKSHPRIVAYGGVDELNSVIGMTLASGPPGWVAEHLGQVQNDLFDLGADLCVPEASGSREKPPLRVTAAQTERLEHWIDKANERLQPLSSFVLPAGSPHICTTREPSAAGLKSTSCSLRNSRPSIPRCRCI